MFSNEDIMNNEKLANVWKLAHGLEVSDEELKKENLPDICDELDSYINSESNNPRKRLSLRASAHLLAGCAEMYKRQVSELFDDVDKLTKDLIRRPKRTDSSSSSGSISSSESEAEQEQIKRANTISHGSWEGSQLDSSETASVSEEMRRAKTMEFDTSFLPAKKKKFQMLRKNKSKLIVPENITRSKTSTDRETGKEFQETSEATSSNDIDLLAPENVKKPAERRRGITIVEESTPVRNPTMLDKEIQANITSVPGRHSNVTGFSAEGFRQDLPFAYTIIHDNIANRVPSQIIISSITHNLNSNH
ncbi:uncharacterized protein LOC124645389 [Helicoverpa zea]|uniref:uncharacterized protein LOC124645389 n=1 Tax=Helicoverpa zea TaxID=7113 RepID=UPI001F58A866|nr:uncharacterized protein LOC124645389 [Helicoverpa zea]